MGDRSVDYPLDTGFRPAGNPLGSKLKTWFKPLKLWIQQLHVKSPVDAVQPPGFCTGFFIRPDQNAVLFLPVIARGLGIAYDGRFFL